MWLWILGILVILLVWSVWFIFPPGEPGAADPFPMWIPIVVSAVVLTLLIGLWAIRRIRAARAARALEKAIAQQAQEQALNAKPEEREEIQALHKQIAEGIAALKASKLGEGSRKGEAALYTLPWYVIVGPPGAGKTTALKHSGLVFPYLDSAGGGVRGVGGTRNCDWWFTNEAILLDTAGRYTTETEDHDEWVSFLEQLHKYRPEKPINGVIVAVSISELLNESDEAIQATASKVRARIDEMQETLKMTLPVYVLFTKIDLVSGFVEFFSDLKKSERGQPWGATFRLDSSKAEPGRMFEDEFGVLVEKLHQRAIRRVNVERSRGVKEKIYEFPLEFASIKRNLADFMQAAFAPVGQTNALGAQTPIIRGFYFTSGTQEGKPLQRVVASMGRAMGLKVGDEEEAPAQKESRSYFLKDVFTAIMFPDQNIAAVTEGELRRRRLRVFAIAAAAALVALVLMIPAIFAFMNNRQLVADTRRVSQGAGLANWNEPDKAVGTLDDLRAHLEMLNDWENHGPPISYGWGMYQGTRLFTPTKDQYVASLRTGFLKPTKELLEQKVRDIKGDPYLQDYNNLKTYLLLADRDRLQDEQLEDFEANKLTALWAEALLPKTQLPEADLKAKLYDHVRFYVKLVKEGKVEPEVLQKPLIESARERLRNADPVKAYYELFVTSLIDKKIDENGPATPDNLDFAPISLDTVFGDRADVTTVVSSKQKAAQGKPYEVVGPFTNRGHAQVLKNLNDAPAQLEREQWVVPQSKEEKAKGDKIQLELKRVRQRYEDDYINAWTEFFRDVDVAIPDNNRQAIAEYRTLSTPEWAYKRLLRTLRDNTVFEDKNKKKLPTTLTADGGVIDQIGDRIRRRVEARTQVSADSLRSTETKDGPPEDRITHAFASMVEFGMGAEPPPPADSSSPAPQKPAKDPGLDNYVGKLQNLAGEMEIVAEGPPSSDTKKATTLFEKAVVETTEQVQALDVRGQELMDPLLMNPLRQGYRAMIRGAGGTASGLWEVEVWPTYRDKLKNRYPFNVSADRDASFDDAVAFFKPKDGILWGFYEKHLADFHIRQNHDFIPVSHLQGANPSANPFTPFNPLMYNCLKRSDEITDAIFSDGADKPKVTFDINLKTVSPIVSDVIFELEGQKRIYRNEKEFWYTFTWPDAKTHGARIQVRGAGGLDEEIVRDGPWGVFRLFESADELTSVKDDDKQFLVTWQMTAPPVTVTMQVRPRRGNHPFPLSFFRGLNCPPSIGDKFGKGK